MPFGPQVPGTGVLGVAQLGALATETRQGMASRQTVAEQRVAKERMQLDAAQRVREILRDAYNGMLRGKNLAHKFKEWVRGFVSQEYKKS